MTPAHEVETHTLVQQRIFTRVEYIISRISCNDESSSTKPLTKKTHIQYQFFFEFLNLVIHFSISNNKYLVVITKLILWRT